MFSWRKPSKLFLARYQTDSYQLYILPWEFSSDCIKNLVGAPRPERLRASAFWLYSSTSFSTTDAIEWYHISEGWFLCCERWCVCSMYFISKREKPIYYFCRTHWDPQLIHDQSENSTFLQNKCTFFSLWCLCCQNKISTTTWLLLYHINLCKKLFDKSCIFI